MQPPPSYQEHNSGRSVIDSVEDNSKSLKELILNLTEQQRKQNELLNNILQELRKKTKDNSDNLIN
jgi:hypothetical protein